MKALHTPGAPPVSHTQAGGFGTTPETISTVHSEEPSRFAVVIPFPFGFLLLRVYLRKLKFSEAIKIKLLVCDIKVVPPGKCVSRAFWLMSQVPSRCRAGEQ